MISHEQIDRDSRCAHPEYTGVVFLKNGKRFLSYGDSIAKVMELAYRACSRKDIARIETSTTKATFMPAPKFMRPAIIESGYIGEIGYNTAKLIGIIYEK